MIYIYSSIEINELKGLIGRVNIIDIREEYLYKIGSIPTSKNIPGKYLELDPSKYLEKDKKYYLYCSFGFKTAKLCAALSSKGYNVVNIIGGYNEFIKK